MPKGIPAGATNIFTYMQLDPVAEPITDRYVLTYDGTASFQLLNSRIVSSAPGRIVFDFTNTANNYLGLVVHSISAGDPLQDIHVVRADQETLFNEGKVFNPDLLEKASNWDVLRFMDWGNTNSSSEVSWETRTTPDKVSWAATSPGDGVPLEVMIRLSNEANTDMWWSVPTKADDTYVRNALALIHAELKPGLKLHVEYSNEVWNWGFQASKYSHNKAAELFGRDANSDGRIDANNTQENVTGSWMVYYGYRSAQIAAMANAEFAGADADRVVTVLAGQAANVGLQQYAVQGISRANVGTPGALFDDYAITTYFGGNMSGHNAADRAIVLGWARGGATGMDAAFRELEFGGALSQNDSLAGVMDWYRRSASFAGQYGLDLVAYEGGAHLTASAFRGAEQADVTGFISRLMNDPRMGDLYTKMIRGFEAAGGTEIMAFADTAPIKAGGYWGVLDHIYQDGSARYDALLAAANDRPIRPGAIPPASMAPGETDSEITTAQRDYVLAERAVNLSFTGAGDFTGVGNALANRIIGGAGANDLAGGAGDDTLLGNAASDILAGGEGDDLLQAMSGHDRITGGAGGDLIDGGEGNDHLYGQSALGGADGADRIFGGEGGDYVQGNAGSDTLEGGDGSDRIQGGQDNDLIVGGAGQDSVNGNLGEDLIDGGLDNDLLRGGQGADILIGGQGDDILMGDRGADTLVGGAGNDALIGGDDADWFMFGAEDLMGGGQLLGDVLDFSHAEGDRIDISALDAVSGGSGDDAFRFIGESDFSRSAGELRLIVRDAGRWTVAGDYDGDGSADFSVSVASRTGGLVAADFVL